MQFLDAIGLAYFWKKIKNWVNINYLSLTGGTIRGNVTFLHQGEGGSSIVVSPSSITKSGHDNHYLFASGKMIPIGEANGVAGLDANGNVPLAQLGNLDTTVAEVVTALPTTNIKKHIYLIEDEDGDTQNQYKEYIYTGDTSATYDASKWEKLGDFRATVDLADYAKKSEAIGNFSPELSEEHVALRLYSVDEDNHKADVIIDKATNEFAGVMTSSDKIKLDGIDTTYAKKSETVNLSEIKVVENPISVTPMGQILSQAIRFSNFNGKIIDIVLKEATSGMAGLMSIRDKNKLDTIPNGATADSAITTAEIDALFA